MANVAPANDAITVERVAEIKEVISMLSVF